MRDVCVCECLVDASSAPVIVKRCIFTYMYIRIQKEQRTVQGGEDP